MYEELIKKLRNRRVCIQSGGDWETDFPIMKEAADAIEGLVAFARFVAEEVFDEDEWENFLPAFPEIACRKLNAIGLVKIENEMWCYEPPKEETE